MAAPVPHLAPPALPAEVDEALNSRAFTFLLGRAMEEKKQEDEAQREEDRKTVEAKAEEGEGDGEARGGDAGAQREGPPRHATH